jgi:hypothetical protein
MMEAEDSVHSDQMINDEIWQHDIEWYVSKFFIITCQVCVETTMDIPQIVNRLECNLEFKKNLA